MAASTFFLSFILAASPQIHVVEAPSQANVDLPAKLIIEAIYPQNYKPVPGSILQSLVQQNAPFPAAFTVLKEWTGKPVLDDKHDVVQTYVYEIQPKLIGKTTVLPFAIFEEGKTRIRAFTDPLEMEFLQVSIAPPPLPQPFVPGKYVPMDYFGVRSDLLEERGSPQHREVIREVVNSKTIPWIEILLAFLAATILAFWSFWHFLKPQKKSSVTGMTRFGVMRTLNLLATTNNISLDSFFHQSGLLLRQYLHLPLSMTDEEVLEKLKMEQRLNAQAFDQLKELQTLSQENRFSTLSSDQKSFEKALILINEILNGAASRR
ncbi:MAG: hypothetical protein WC222_03710 [Parachlamydiales bacterium]|jgi:hypothetical protein